MSSAALFILLAVSPGEVEAHIAHIASKLEISPPKLVVVDQQLKQHPHARAWTTSYMGEPRIVIRRWTLRNIGNDYALYLAAHETCHVYLGHWKQIVQDLTPMPQMQKDADDCARKMVHKRVWRRMMRAQERIGQLGRKHRAMLSSR